MTWIKIVNLGTVRLTPVLKRREDVQNVRNTQTRVIGFV